MDLYRELTSIIDCLNARGIEYAVCGGLAVAFHGYPRFTGDIDIMLMPADLPRAKEALRSIDYSIAAGPFPLIREHRGRARCTGYPGSRGARCSPSISLS
ncbi:MAG: nucleotidyltransferase family protein [Spirochaetes bacterium]|nr:nucleotidyltransferase family protein [Spirochaetota bacterium]